MQIVRSAMVGVYACAALIHFFLGNIPAGLGWSIAAMLQLQIALFYVT